MSHPTVADAIVRRLSDYGIDTAFGIPGIHTVSLYRALGHSRIRHVTPRHEQGAAFMADGYARTTGRPAVCVLITGAGLTNAATAIAQAYSDSVPMLVLSSAARTAREGLGAGDLHELRSQSQLMDQLVARSVTIRTPEHVEEGLALAFTLMRSGRPRPVHVQVPLDVLDQPAVPGPAGAWALPGPPVPCTQALDAAASLLAAARQVAIVVGGGARHAGVELDALATDLQAPVICTVAGKGLLPDSHPSSWGTVLAFDAARDFIREADVVLAVGTEWSETDRFPDGRPLQPGGRVIRIDVEATQFAVNLRADVALLGDARVALAALSARLTACGRTSRSPARIPSRPALDALVESWHAPYRACAPFVAAIRRATPDGTIFTADSTQLAYAANHLLETDSPRRWHACTTGYGTLGYALPAAIGARIAAPESPVVAIVGDGGLQFSSPELIVATELDLPLVAVIWNSRGYAEIRDHMAEVGMRPLGVTPRPPDFRALAIAHGWEYRSAATPADLASTLAESVRARSRMLLEVDRGA